MIDGVRMVRKLANARALDGFRGEEVAPGAAVDSDEAILDWIRANSETAYHPIGTCKLGVDELAVVDPELCVRGLEGLAVVDASVMPTLVSGNTNAPTIMIAEKFAANL